MYSLPSGVLNIRCRPETCWEKGHSSAVLLFGEEPGRYGDRRARRRVAVDRFGPWPKVGLGRGANIQFGTSKAGSGPSLVQEGETGVCSSPTGPASRLAQGTRSGTCVSGGAPLCATEIHSSRRHCGQPGSGLGSSCMNGGAASVSPPSVELCSLGAWLGPVSSSCSGRLGRCGRLSAHPHTVCTRTFTQTLGLAAAVTWLGILRRGFTVGADHHRGTGTHKAAHTHYDVGHSRLTLHALQHLKNTPGL